MTATFGRFLANVDTLSNAVSVLSQSVSVLSQQVSVLSQAVSVQSQAISVLSNQVSILSQAVSVLSQQVSILSNSVSVLSNAVSVISQQVSVISQKLSAGGFPLRSYLAGCNMNTADNASVMSITAGAAMDGTNSGMMSLAAITKTVSVWAVGNNAGGLDTGTITSATWYHWFVIKRTDTGVVDALFSLSPSAPTLPASYTLSRRIGSTRTNATNNWLGFLQDGDYFRWLASILDVNAGNPGTGAVTRTLTVPTGANVFALFHAVLDNTDVTTAGGVIFSDLAANDEAASSTAAPLYSIGYVVDTAGRTRLAAGMYNVRTNTSAQIRSRLDGSPAGMTLRVATFGWLDPRGKAT